MAFSGFGKNSGPSAQAGAQNPFANFPRHPSPSSPLPVPPRSSIDYRDLDASEGISSRPFISTHSLPGTQKSNEPPFRRGDVKAHSLKDPAAQYQRPPADLQQVTSRHLRPGGPIKTAEVQSIRRTSSPFTQSPHEISNASRSPLGSDKSYSDPYGVRLSRPVSHNSVYAGGQRPHIQDVQQYSPSPVWVNNSKLSSHNITPPVQERLGKVFLALAE